VDGGNTVLQVRSDASASVLAAAVRVDPAATPWLRWRWKVSRALSGSDVRTRAGDDYAARVYLSFDVPPGTLGIGTRLALKLARALRGSDVPDAAINYIWDNRHAVGTWQANAYTDRTRMQVLRSGATDAGRWVDERRDVAADFRHAFGHAPIRVTGLAVASDTDNTGEEARAGFADFRFVGKDEAC